MLPLRHDIGRVTFIVLHDFIFVRGRKYHKKIVDVNVSLLLKQKTPASANADTGAFYEILALQSLNSLLTQSGLESITA